MTSKKIPVISFFSGSGAMDLGFEDQGFKPVIAIDNEQSSIDTYNHNRKTKVAMKGDLSSLTGKDIIAIIEKRAPSIKPRGVIGGPPCQSFSQSNVHSKSKDPRHKLPLKYAAILKTLNQKYNLDFFLFENVTGIKSKNHLNRYKKILVALEDAGFNIFEQDLNASWFKVPQNRRRLFIVGINKKLYPSLKFEFPVGDLFNKVNVRDRIGDLPDPTYFSRNLSPKDIPIHPNHWTMNPKSKRFKPNGNPGKGRSLRRLNWESQSLTIAYGHREIYVHPNGHRRLSIFESMRLQAFPDRYVLKGNFTQQVTQVSDAVPPPLSAAIALALKEEIYEPIEKFRQKIIMWSKKNKRDFPWRSTVDPYEVLVAEKLLQQTLVTPKVVEIYEKILDRYPTVQILAQAEVVDISKYFASLGFKYRALELHNLAQIIDTQYSGQVPQNLDQLLALPGIGDYIARALLCFVFDKPVPIVDTNVARLLYRFFGVEGKFPKNPSRKPQLINMASNLIPNVNVKEFNYAILDFCASVCTASNPDCNHCPLKDMCVYGRELEHFGFTSLRSTG